MKHGRAAITGLLVVVLASGGAAAQDAERSPEAREAPPAPPAPETREPRVALSVAGDCPAASALSLALEVVLPGTRIDSGREAGPGTTTVSVEDLGRRYLVMVGADRRALDDPGRDCSERARSAALLVGLPLGPAATPRAAVAASPGLVALASPANTVSGGAPEGGTEISRPALPSLAPPRRRGPRQIDLGVQVAAELPAASIDSGGSVAVGGGLRLRLAWGGTGLSLGASGHAPQRLRVSSSAGSVDATLLRVPIDAGLDLSRTLGRVELGGQLGLVAAPFSARGESLAHNRSGFGVDVGARLAGELRVPLGRRLGLALLVEASVIPVPAGLSVDGRGDVGRTPQLWLGAGAGGFWRVR